MTNAGKHESVDEIVSHSAIVLADQIQKAAAWAKSEMDLQIEVAGALKEFARRAKITLEVHHNVTVATGRPDSVYSNVIVEYKDPGTLSGNRDAANNKKLIEQIRQRFYDMRQEENRPMNSMFGVGTDGKYFVFVRFRDEKWTDQEPLEVNRHSTERFLWALYNLGQKGKPYQPEYLHGDFGSDSLIAQEGVRTLYDEILKTEHPKAQVFFNQWKILFGEVCGYDVENLSDKLKKLAEFYGVEGKPHPGQLLFALHTYYALLIKLLAAEIVSFFNPWMTRQVEKLQNATTSSKLRRELDELERGGVFHTLGITNFLEGDLFAWYLPVWGEPIEKVVRQMIQKLDDYNPGTFSEDPAQSRDLLKKLYQQLFPKSVRHDLGEYYTPDWLAEHVLNVLDYKGDPEKRVLDPACGSGTFLVMAINRIRRWYDENREKCAYDEGELLKKILANVIGFDLNPLAVMAARTNYLVAVKDLIRHTDHVEIPVYLCDSIITPAEYGDLFTGASLGNVARVPCSAMKPPYLLVPKEIAQSPKDVAKYADILETCVKNGYIPKEFLSRCRDERLDIVATEEHLHLYKELVRLDKENKNGIWARIIKNNFAPLFVGKVDYFIGNPPWVNWEHLPEGYRQATAPLWQQYGLFSHKGYRAKLGGGKDDISILLTYVSHDCYLRDSGALGFVITQSVFKTKGGGEGFRRFEYQKKGKAVYLDSIHVDDFSDIQAFEGATNRTAVFICKKSSKAVAYPVPYIRWRKRDGMGIAPDSLLQDVVNATERQTLAARPIDKDQIASPWLTAPAGALSGIEKAIGKGAYRAYAGCCTWLNGVYWLRILERLPNGELIVENLSDVGKIKVEQVRAKVEHEVVYPLLRGRDVSRWMAEPSAHVIMANRKDKLGGIPESDMRKEFPAAYGYFQRFEDRLRARSGYRQFFQPSDPFYSMYNVGPYTFKSWKVMWPEVGNEVRAGVCGPTDGEIAIADHTIIAIGCETGQEAHFIAALLNSAPARVAASGYIVLHPSPHILEHIAIPQYKPDSKEHLALSGLSERCHVAARKNDSKAVEALELKVDEAAARLWGITANELKSIQEAVARANGNGSEDE